MVFIGSLFYILIVVEKKDFICCRMRFSIVVGVSAVFVIDFIWLKWEDN